MNILKNSNSNKYYRRVDWMRKKVVKHLKKRVSFSHPPPFSSSPPLCAEFRREKLHRWSTLAHRSLRNPLVCPCNLTCGRRGRGRVEREMFRYRRVSRSALSRIESRIKRATNRGRHDLWRSFVPTMEIEIRLEDCFRGSNFSPNSLSR